MQKVLWNPSGIIISYYFKDAFCIKVFHLFSPLTSTQQTSDNISARTILKYVTPYNRDRNDYRLTPGRTDKRVR